MAVTESAELPLFLTVKEAAEVARRSPDAMYWMRSETKRTGVQHGPRWRKRDGRLLVHRDDLIAWLSGEDDDA